MTNHLCQPDYTCSSSQLNRYWFCKDKQRRTTCVDLFHHVSPCDYIISFVFHQSFSAWNGCDIGGRGLMKGAAMRDVTRLERIRSFLEKLWRLRIDSENMFTKLLSEEIIKLTLPDHVPWTNCCLLRFYNALHLRRWIAMPLPCTWLLLQPHIQWKRVSFSPNQNTINRSSATSKNSCDIDIQQ